MTDSALITWSVLMPVKVLAQAKSRLAPLAGPRRGELALALAKDTLSVVLKCEAAARVVVITDDEAAAGALGALGAPIAADGAVVAFAMSCSGQTGAPVAEPARKKPIAGGS